MNAPIASRRFALRASTADAHAALDASIGAWNEVSDYKRYLAGAARFRLAVESRLSQPDDAYWSPTRIGPQLIADLTDLDVDAHLSADDRSAVDPAGMLGIFYVLEGSALGAKLLLRRAEALGLSETFGARHLHLQARAGNWTRFVERLETAADYDEKLVADAAIATFQEARNAFAGSDHVDA